MTAYRRLRIEGGCYFFTAALADRRATVLTDHIDLLRVSVQAVRSEHPFRIEAMVVLPDHIHAVWTLPAGDSDFSTRWKKIKTAFTKSLGGPWPRSASKVRKGERGLWQRRFWEHAIRDDRDFSGHVEYCWINPVKHGLVRRVADWPHSSFHAAVRAGIVSTEWSGTIPEGDFGE